MKIKIWSLSISIIREISDDDFSDFAKALDYIQDKYNVVICKSAGNTANALYLKEKERICGENRKSYYKTDKVLTNEELEDLDAWEVYEDNIPVDELGGHVIYIRAIDNGGNVTYINSGKIMYGGYSTYLKLDEDKDYVDTLNVSDKSEFIYQYKYENSISYLDGYNTMFITNHPNY